MEPVHSRHHKPLTVETGRRLRLLLVLVVLVPQAGAEIRLVDIAGRAGLGFVHASVPTAGKPMIEAVPGGVAAFDADADGLVDLFFTNGADPASLSKTGERHANRLFRNLGEMRFVDVTEQSGLVGRGYSMGVAVADYDGDGATDLFVAGYRSNALFRNEGDGTFTDVTETAGIDSGQWSVAAGWFDHDRDGDLDLLVVNYLEWDRTDDRYCGDRERGLRIYCSPTYYGGLPDSLYRNRGDGTFEDISRVSGIGRHAGKGMSVAFADYDLDGWMDFFVANDTEADFLFRNKGDGTFEESGLLAGVALASDGRPISSMGVDFADYDNDGLPDIHVTAINRQTFPLFRNVGGGMFEDFTARSGLHELTVSRSGWSNRLVDLDNDGQKDLFVAGSHVNDLAEHFENARYRQANAVFRNLGDGRFADVSGDAARFPEAAHRGATVADLDMDGRPDITVAVLGGPAQLWRNESPPGNRWIDVRLVGEPGNLHGLGARVTVGSQVVVAISSVGYASSSLVPLHFGLGPSPTVSVLTVEWPDGTEQTVRIGDLNRVVTVRKADAAEP